MNKKAIFCLGLSMFYLQGAYASDDVGKDWRYSTSVRLYNAERSSTQTRATTVLLGFSALHKSNIFASANAMPAMTFVKEYENSFGSQRVEFSKSDADLNVGYLFSEYIGAAVGVKYISTRTKAGSAVVNEANSICPNYSAASRIPVANKFSGYLNVAYAYDCKTNSDAGFVKSSYKSDITTVDTGLAASINQTWSGLLGYRWIRFGNKSGGIDSRYTGFTLGASANF